MSILPFDFALMAFRRWNQTIILPITYPSLLLSSRLVLTIWDIQGAGKAVPVGGATMFLFNEKR